MPSPTVSETVIDIHRHLVSPRLLANLASLPANVFLRANPGNSETA